MLYKPTKLVKNPFILCLSISLLVLLVNIKVLSSIKSAKNRWCNKIYLYWLSVHQISLLYKSVNKNLLSIKVSSFMTAIFIMTFIKFYQVLDAHKY